MPYVLKVYLVGEKRKKKVNSSHTHILDFLCLSSRVGVCCISTSDDGSTVMPFLSTRGTGMQARTAVRNGEREMALFSLPPRLVVQPFTPTHIRRSLYVGRTWTRWTQCSTHLHDDVGQTPRSVK